MRLLFSGVCVAFAVSSDAASSIYGTPAANPTLKVVTPAAAYSSIAHDTVFTDVTTAFANVVGDDSTTSNYLLFKYDVLNDADDVTSGADTDDFVLFLKDAHIASATPTAKVVVFDADKKNTSDAASAVHSTDSTVQEFSGENLTNNTNQILPLKDGEDISVVFATDTANQVYIKCGMQMTFGVASDGNVDALKTFLISDAANWGTLACECTIDKFQTTASTPVDVDDGIAAGNFYAQTGTVWTVTTGYIVLIMATVSDDSITAYAEADSDGEDYTIGGEFTCPTIDGTVISGTKTDKVLEVFSHSITADAKYCMWHLDHSNTTLDTTLATANHLALNFSADVKASEGTSLWFKMFGGVPAALTAAPTLTTGGQCYTGLLDNWVQIDSAGSDDSSSTISATTLTSFLVLTAGIFCLN